MSSIKPPKTPPDWDSRFLQLAAHVASWGKDPSTKVGAIAVRQRRILGTAYNGLPSGVADTDHRLKNRDVRLAMTVHAEANLVAYAARNGVCLAGADVYIWPLMTCSQCAALLIQADIGRIVVPDFVEPLRWQESFNKAREMLLEASVKVDRISARGGGISPDEAGIPAEEHSEQNPLDVFSA